MIDKDLERRISALHKRYPTYSIEEELVCEVSGWINRASKSLIPNSNLRLAQDKIEIYGERK